MTFSGSNMSPWPLEGYPPEPPSAAKGCVSHVPHITLRQERRERDNRLRALRPHHAVGVSSPSAERRENNFKGLKDFYLKAKARFKPRPESGIDNRVCAVFARQRPGCVPWLTLRRWGGPCKTGVGIAKWYRGTSLIRKRPPHRALGIGLL